MNKSAIKNFAVNARIKLMDQITQKAFELGISLDHMQEPAVFQDGFLINGKFFKKYEIKQRAELVKHIQAKSLSQVVEEVAYTWFNRLIAIRFMEVNEYLPIGVRVLSSIECSKTEPDVVREVLNVDLGLSTEDLAVVYRLQDEQSRSELFKYILVKQCNKLGDIMPVLFEQIADYTELLLPDNLLGEGSVIRDLVVMIAEDDWKEQVEIIGWLYQYYISQKKDEVFADLANNKKITKEDIPAATQLFTPDWLVKYMVENSLGRQWLESHPNAALQAKWEYYLEEAEQEPAVQRQLDALKNPNLNPEDLKVLDPAMGSGHILVYAFDVLYDIYESAGYPERDIPKMIIEKNLYGLDIDDRAAQLAYFAVMMKGRSYNRRLFRDKLAHNLCGIQESNAIPKEEVLDIFGHLAVGERWSDKLRTAVAYLVDVFYDAKEYGSIIEVENVDFDSLQLAVEGIRNNEVVLDLFSAPQREVILEIMPALIQQGRIMSQKYDVVVTNPPYMGRRNMGEKLKTKIDSLFPGSKNDLFAVFMDKSMSQLVPYGLFAGLTMHSWMFLSYFSNLREQIVKEKMIVINLHLGARAFEDIGGEVVQTCSFVIKNYANENYNGSYFNLTNFNHAKHKEIAYLNKENKYRCSAKELIKIPGNPVSYWVSNKVRQLFAHDLLGKYIVTVGQNLTGNNEKYLRYLWEVNSCTIGISQKWLLYAKGGGFRKWYGNYWWVVNWSHEAVQHYRDNKICRIIPENYWYKRGISWSLLAGDIPSFRPLRADSTHDIAGSSFYLRDEHHYNYFLALLNSKITSVVLAILNPTLSSQLGDMGNIPAIYEASQAERVQQLVSENIALANTDWDYYEISWEFKQHPLLSHQQGAVHIAEGVANWYAWAELQCNKLKANEEELNRIFIHIYGLQEELTPEISEKEVTIRPADRVRDIKSFLSYAVGCMFGRYSLDEVGLIYAGGEFDASRCRTFSASMDNILPLTDDEYFSDDIVSRLIDFVSITFGLETLEENLDYIAESLNKKATQTSRQAIRRYFLKEFYKDHVQTYQKRPIYWLFDSGKNDGFKALIYMHRYDLSTVAKVRTDYLHILQRKYEAESNRLDMTLAGEVSPREKAVAKKKQEKLQKQLMECYQYDQVIAHVANQKISLDLDDGVKANYARFQEIQIPQGDGKKPLKANLLAKIS